MKVFIVLIFFTFVYFIYGFYLAQNEITVVSPSLKPQFDGNFYDYRGVINVHSDQSIGSSSINQIIKSAQQTKLDFILFSDLNLFASQYAFEGYHENTLVLTGQKLSYLDSRFIVYSLNKDVLGPTMGEAQIKLADLLTQKPSNDHLIIYTYPFEKGYMWNGELPQGLDGFELINLKSLSHRAWDLAKFSTLWSLFVYPFNSTLALARLFNEPTEELNLLDQNGEKQKLLGFAGAEASARAIPMANYLIKFPSYQKTFEIFSNHVLLKSELTGNPKADRIKIFQALKNGNFYLAFDLIGKTTGFQCNLEDKSKLFPMGSSVHKSKNLKLKIKIPFEPHHFYEVVVYRNGARYLTYNQKEIELSIKESGTYRVQVRVSPYLPLPDARKWISWIYTNPFYVID